MIDLTKDFETERALLPDGDYFLTIKKAKYKTSKAGDLYLNLTLVTDNNRCVFHTLNIFHKNDQPRNISLASLKRILLSIGKTTESLKHIDEAVLPMLLDNKRVSAYVTIQAQDGFQPKNDIKYFNVEPVTQPKIEMITTDDIPF